MVRSSSRARGSSAAWTEAGGSQVDPEPAPALEADAPSLRGVATVDRPGCAGDESGSVRKKKRDSGGDL